MSYRIVILPYVMQGKPLSADSAEASFFDAVIPEGADAAFIKGVADRWSGSGIARPLRIYAPADDDSRLLLLQKELEEEHSFYPEEYSIFTPEPKEAVP